MEELRGVTFKLKNRRSRLYTYNILFYKKIFKKEKNHRAKKTYYTTIRIKIFSRDSSRFR